MNIANQPYYFARGIFSLIDKAHPKAIMAYIRNTSNCLSVTA